MKLVLLKPVLIACLLMPSLAYLRRGDSYDDSVELDEPRRFLAKDDVEDPTTAPLPEETVPPEGTVVEEAPAEEEPEPTMQQQQARGHPAQCWQDRDCPRWNQYCDNNGRCQRKGANYCDSRTPCRRSGYTCNYNRRQCEQTRCWTNRDCGWNEYCNSRGQCRTKPRNYCDRSNFCQRGYYCDYRRNQCKKNENHRHCRRNRDCGWNEYCDGRNHCRRYGQ